MIEDFDKQDNQDIQMIKEILIKDLK